jgi:polysaccharide export outer membrane protein
VSTPVQVQRYLDPAYNSNNVNLMSLIRCFISNFAFCLLVASLTSASQAQDHTAPIGPIPVASSGASASIADWSAYILGPGDQIALFVEDLAEDFSNRTFRVDTNGELSLPIIGRIQAGGLSIAALESESKARLVHVLNDPKLSISIVNFGSQPISVLGAVNTPGIHQLEGRKTLFEVLSLAGGLRPDAGYQVKITRDIKWGRIPIPQAQIDTSGQSSVASIKLNDIINATNPKENILIFPGDAISVPKADLVYVVGSVTRPGGYALNEHRSLSALQIISLAEGLQKTAASSRARILRSVPGSANRTQIALDLRKLMNGKNADVQLQPNDILFIPNSEAKVIRERTIETAVASLTGMAIYGRF